MLIKYRRFPNNWLRYVTREEMSSSERLVWRCINDHQGTNPDGFPSLQLIADECGMWKKSVIRIIKSLEAKNLVEVKHVGGNAFHKTNRYVAMVPETWLQRMEEAKQNEVSSGHRRGVPATPAKVSPGPLKGSGGRHHENLSKSTMPFHGKASLVHHEGRGILDGVNSPFEAGRYHSLVVIPDDLPPELELTAWTDDGLAMATQHRELPRFGVQLHLESILTPEGPGSSKLPVARRLIKGAGQPGP